MRVVEVVREPSGLAAIAREWDELLASSAADNVFLTWEWLRTWWEVFGAALDLRLVLVREGGRLVAAAPCKVEWREHYGMRFRQLEFIGTGHTVCPDFLDLVVSRGREEELVPVLLGALAAERADWDKLMLSDLREDSPTLGPLGRGLAGLGLVPRTETDRACPFLALPRSWGACEARLSHNFRRNHRKKRRRLGGELAVWQPGEDLDDAMDALARLHQQRMGQAGRGGHFAKPDYRSFHRLVAERFAGRGWLYLAFLVRAGRRIAVRYGFLYRGTYYAYQSGFDPALADASPGEVMLGRVVEDLIGRGVAEFNFLRGAQPHKLLWASGVRRTVRIEGWTRSARGLGLALLDRLAAGRRVLRARAAGLLARNGRNDGMPAAARGGQQEART